MTDNKNNILSIHSLSPTKGKDIELEIMGKRNTRAVFHPIVNVRGEELLAFEVLSRCPKELDLGERPPFAIIKENHQELDRICLENIASALERFDHIESHIFINCLLPNIDYLYVVFEKLVKTRTLVIEFDINHQMFSVDALIAQTKKLKEAGFKIAIDDIGETDTDLNLLSLLRPEFIKIDMSIGMGLSQNQASQDYVVKAVKFAKENDSTVIIEGIENTMDLEAAVHRNCVNIQGFLFSRPLELIPEQENLFAKEVIKKAV